MKILWIKSDLLHPTTKGGQIRTLGMLKCLRREHEIHYAAFASPDDHENRERAQEYCHQLHTVPLDLSEKSSYRFQLELLTGLFSRTPANIRRYRSSAMRKLLANLIARERFDRIVCDFLIPSINLPSLQGIVLFQHNVESVIWQRRTEHSHFPERLYLRWETNRMFRYEERMCRAAEQVIAVSPVDAGIMRNLFALDRVADVPTGVDLEYFARPANYPLTTDLVFVGSMDWDPNIDGVRNFYDKILPLIWQKKPECTFAIVGRFPTPEIWAMAKDPRITVTGTVPDVRPYLWQARVSVVPLKIGGGTRLKIYEAMAARTPTVSTHVGAEGLVASDPTHIRIADSPAEFAQHCLSLLSDDAERSPMIDAAYDLVWRSFSWERVARQFETLLQNPVPSRVLVK